MAICSNADCTIAVTGKCVLLHEPPNTCPNFRADESTVEPGLEDESHVDSELHVTPAARSFHAGFELGTADAAEIMRAQYGTLIAILGQFDVGKTCFLASLYLLVSNVLSDSNLAFAGSLTLNGFEARARGLRKWQSGQLPKQLADHTILTDPRTPAIMHLALREMTDDQRRFDLLITDLPGEWSTDLVKDADTAPRFKFLQRADAIVVTLDGPMLNGPQRHVAVQNAKLLLTRLATTISVDTSTPLVLMVTKSDELAMAVPKIVEDVVKHATVLGFQPTVIPVAAISRTPDSVRSGTGVMEVVEFVLDRRGSRQAIPISGVRSPISNRHFARIRE